MHALDWIVLVATLTAIVSYGIYKTRSRNAGVIGKAIYEGKIALKELENYQLEQN